MDGFGDPSWDVRGNLMQQNIKWGLHCVFRRKLCANPGVRNLVFKRLIFTNILLVISLKI
jgi:hypothetical protein